MVALALALLTLAGFFIFPGHTWLASDSQIYAPLLEHLSDPSVLARDLIVTRPHLGWTAYDETALLLHRLLPLSIQQILTLEQFCFRFLALFGIYLIARGCRFRAWPSLFAAAVYGLGVTVPGTAIFTVEADPVPRGFALGLLLAAIGLTFCARFLPAAVAGSAALLFHAPLTIPFWLWFAYILWREKQLRPLIPPAIAAALLVLFWRFQPAGVESPEMFARIDAAWEHILRMRAGYVWVSMWPARLWVQYVLLFAASIIAARRLALTALALILPALGVLSMPVSWLLLEAGKWSLIPQLQPARYVLYVALFAQFFAVLAGMAAARRRIWWETAVWMLLAVALTLHPDLFSTRWKPPLQTGNMQTAELDDLCRWAQSTPRDAVFLFPDAGRSLVPGVFRAQAERALYVDWKAGGQANFFRGLALEWFDRWQSVMTNPPDPAHLRALGIGYIAMQRPLPGRDPVFRNGAFLVYRLR